MAENPAEEQGNLRAQRMRTGRGVGGRTLARPLLADLYLLPGDDGGKQRPQTMKKKLRTYNVVIERDADMGGLLITRNIDYSLPYRYAFAHSKLMMKS